MLKIGLTGGIGSGKTTVAHIFEVLGIPLYYADDAAKKLMNEDVLLAKEIIDKFGEESYLNGKLNRKYLADTVFSDPKKTLIINSIIHPATIADAEKWFRKQQAPYAIKEAALIFEANAQSQLDYVIGVACPQPIRIARVMQRDNVSAQAVKERIERQMNDDEKMSKCDFVIINNDEQMLIPQVLQIHNQLLKADK